MLSKARKMYWNFEDEEALRKVWPLHCAGKISKEQLEKAFEKNYNAIMSKRKTLGLPPASFAPATKNTFLYELLKQAGQNGKI